MKRSLIAVIAVGVGIAIVVSGVFYQETYNQNCIEDDGKVTGFLKCTRVFEDFADPLLSKYDVEYDELVTRKVSVTAQVATEIIPERNCHKFSKDEVKNLPENLKSDMKSSLRDLEYEYDSNDGFLDRYASEFSFEEAFTFLEKYDFQLTTKKIEGDTLPKLQDTTYLFECIFEDENYQYKIGLEFESHYDGYGRLVFVNFTNNDQGLPVIENDNITLYTGGFNQTVVFKNDFDYEITIDMINPQLSESQRNPPDKIVIPAGKVWSYFFRIDAPDDEPIYQYIVNPDALNGIIVVKGYPRCMTENEVTSLYSQVEAYPKFPSYLPDEYSFECGVHNMNSYVHLVYYTDELRPKFDDKANAAFDREFFSSGGIRVDYYNDFITSNWIANPDYDKFKKAKEKAEHPWAKTLTIAGDPAVMVKEYFWKSGEQKSFNKLTVFADNEIWYSVRSGLPESELIKIAESLFQ